MITVSCVHPIIVSSAAANRIVWVYQDNKRYLPLTRHDYAGQQNASEIPPTEAYGIPDYLAGRIDGNKYRKLHSLCEQSPDTFRTVISTGGNQSNLMYSLAVLCREKGWSFVYYTPAIPPWLKKNPRGNYALAIGMGACIVEVIASQLQQTIKQIEVDTRNKADVLFVPQGAAFSLANPGIQKLAEEIRFLVQNDHFGMALKTDFVNIILSSGTGYTAYALQQFLPEYNTHTYACVGGEAYLREQFLNYVHGFPSQLIPNILPSIPGVRYAFPHPDIFKTYKKNKESGIEFDLIYDCVTWLSMEQNLEGFNENPLLFIHSGGLHGNPTMLERYLINP